jgi:hypothetical protein
MKVLSDKKYTEIIAWTPSGKSFNIIKPKVFTTDILPSHFKSAKYSSFTRKLHRWGFMRHYRGEEAGAFYHKCFQKGRLDLVEKMTCHKTDPPKVVPSTKKTTNTAPSQSLAPRPVNSISSIGNPTSQHHSQPLHVPLKPPNSTGTDLNVAIEMEVNRRLKERINNAAALSRHALLMQMQQKAQSQIRDPRLLAWEQAAQGLSRPNSLMSNMLNPSLAAAAAFKFDPTGMPLNYSTYGDLAAFNSLPGQNIQGAKTA